MNVCHLISGDLWAGAEAVAVELLAAQKAGSVVEPQALVFNEGRLAEELRGAGIPTQVLNEKEHSFAGLLRRVRRHLVETTPDVLHSHRYKENLLAFLASRGVSSVALVATQHGLPEKFGKTEAWGRQLKMRLNFLVLRHFFGKTVGVSADICRFFREEIGFDPHSIAMIHNGLYIPDRPRILSVDGRFTIGSAGRLFPVKDYGLMVEVARILSETESVKFVLAGEGPERTELEERVERYRLADRFHLWGHRDQMDPFYQQVDLYLCTSVHEGIPMAILEAMARGIPVVAPRVGGLPEIVEDGREGFLVDGRDPAAFVEKCRLLARDTALYQSMSHAARERARNEFSRESMAEGYTAVYREILSLSV